MTLRAEWIGLTSVWGVPHIAPDFLRLPSGVHQPAARAIIPDTPDRDRGGQELGQQNYHVVEAFLQGRSVQVILVECAGRVEETADITVAGFRA